MAHLWTNGPAPWEYIEYILCRHVYHCTPQVLRAMPPEDILTALTILGVEADVRKTAQALRK